MLRSQDNILSFEDNEDTLSQRAIVNSRGRYRSVSKKHKQIEQNTNIKILGQQNVYLIGCLLLTFSEWKILNINVFALKKHIQFIFFKTAYFLSTLFAPHPHSRSTMNKTVRLQHPVTIL